LPQVKSVNTKRQETVGRQIFLLSCGKRKKAFRAKARDLYDGALFRKMLEYAQRHNADAIFILSAKHGLLNLDDVLDPYEQTLNSMSSAEVKAWAERVLQKLSQRADVERDHFTILASERYRRHIIPHLHHCCVPMEGLRIGQQLRFLTRDG